MILLIIIAALSAAGIASTIVVARRDGYRRLPVRPRSEPTSRTKTKEIRPGGAT